MSCDGSLINQSINQSIKPLTVDDQWLT